MAEGDQNAAADAGGADKLLSDPAGNAGGDTGGSGGQGGGVLAELADGGDGGNPPPSWREDWREALAGGDEALGKQLKRYATPENFAKSYRELHKKLSAGHQAPTLGDNATAEEVAAYRKQIGVPETADGYGLSFGEGTKPSEADTEVLAGFGKFMHDRHIPPAGVKAAFEWYTQRIAESRDAAVAAEQNAKVDALVELRKDFPGTELKRNLAIADEFLEAHELGALLEARLPSGKLVKHDAGALKAIIAAARSYADDESLIGGDGAGGGKSLEEEKDELIRKSVSGTKLTPAENSRLDAIYGALHAREERQGRRRA